MIKASSIAFFSLCLIACGGGSGGDSNGDAGLSDQAGSLVGGTSPANSEYTKTTSKTLADFTLPAVPTGINGQDFEGVWLVKTTTTRTNNIKDVDLDNELITNHTSVGLMTIIANTPSEYKVINCTETVLQNSDLALVGGKLEASTREEYGADLYEHEAILNILDGKISGTINITNNNDHGEGHTENKQTNATINAVKISDATVINDISEVEAKIEFSGVDMSEGARCVGVTSYTGNANIKQDSENVALSGEFFMGIFEQDTNELGTSFKSILVSDDRRKSAGGINDAYWSSYLSYHIASKSLLTLIDESYRYYGDSPVDFITNTRTYPDGGIFNSEVTTEKARVNPGVNMYLNKADNDHVQMSGIISGDISRRATIGFKLNN